MTKDLGFKNLLGYFLLARPPLDKNLFSLRFEAGSYFLKSIKKSLHLGKEFLIVYRGLLNTHNTEHDREL